MSSTPELNKAFWAKCGECQHIWPAAYYPYDLAKFARVVARSVCPKCGEDKRVFIAKQNDGVLLEPEHG